MKPVLHYLRIAWTVFCGGACVLLIALWVRSYWRWDQIDVPLAKSYGVSILSDPGRICLWDYADPGEHYKQLSIPMDKMVDKISKGEALTLEDLSLTRFEDVPHQCFSDITGILDAPYRSLVLPFAVLAVLPWIRLRFGLRTLLIATTLIAVVLGLIVWTAG
jgi:hypothetical protein